MKRDAAALTISDLVVRPSRPVDETKVKALAESIERIGLMHPIAVDEDRNVLAGVHRVRAFELLGRKAIPAIVHMLRDAKRELATLDENLCRNEIKAAEWGALLNRRDELLEQLGQRATTGTNLKNRTGEQNSPVPKTTAQVAKEAGLSERVAQQYKQIDRDLAPDVKKTIRGTELEDSKTDLLELARMKPEEQRKAVKRALKTGKKPWKARGVNKEADADVRFTPRDLIGELHGKYRFTVDAASDPKSPAAKLIGRHWTVEDDGLEESWRGERVWLNPPYSTCADWVAKAEREMAEGCELVVILVPANRTDQGWWHTHVENVRDGRGRLPWTLTTRFLLGRTSFGTPDDPNGDKSGSPGFGCVLLVYERAEKKGRRR